MEKTFRYRLYPNVTQRELMSKTFGCCRYVYNRVLGMREEEHKAGMKAKGMNSYITLLPTWKRTDAPWLAEVDSMALQQSLRDLDKAYRNFFRKPGRVGFPRFKSKRNNTRSYRTNDVTVVDDKHIRLPKVGAVKARVSRPVEGRILSATVKQVPSGRYYVMLCCTDVPESDIPQGTIEMLGIDAGVHDIATCSDGTHVRNPRSLARSERRLAHEQRRLSRKRRGSNNRARQRVRVARVHERVANQRADALHKFTTKAVAESQGIAVEDLNVAGMVRNHHLAKAVEDASMSEMVRQLEYKCAWYGRGFVKVGRFFPSSKTCSACGSVKAKLSLGERTYVCEECGLVMDRDLNAAMNIAREGRRLMMEGTAGHAGTSGAAKGSRNASGAGIRPAPREGSKAICVEGRIPCL